MAMNDQSTVGEEVDLSYLKSQWDQVRSISTKWSPNEDPQGRKRDPQHDLSLVVNYTSTGIILNCILDFHGEGDSHLKESWLKCTFIDIWRLRMILDILLCHNNGLSNLQWGPLISGYPLRGLIVHIQWSELQLISGKISQRYDLSLQHFLVHVLTTSHAIFSRVRAQVKEGFSRCVQYNSSFGAS